MQNAGRMTSLSFGLQVRLSLETAKSKPKSKPKSQPKPKPLPQDTATLAISDEEIDLIMRPVVFGEIQEVAVPEVERPHLDDVASILMQYPTIRISIEGHTCNSATETEDLRIGLARAEAVARYLKSKGIRRNRMVIGAAKERDPALSNNPAANYRKRRVVISVE
jgi:outer membrane protein OmpA-like peptidoglycan-associated protein